MSPSSLRTETIPLHTRRKQKFLSLAGSQTRVVCAKKLFRKLTISKITWLNTMACSSILKSATMVALIVVILLTMYPSVITVSAVEGATPRPMERSTPCANPAWPTRIMTAPPDPPASFCGSPPSPSGLPSTDLFTHLAVYYIVILGSVLYCNTWQCTIL